MATLTELDVLSDENVTDPYPFFELMRNEHPAHYSEKYRAWFLYRHADVLAALRSPAFSSDRVMPFYRSLPPEQQEIRKPTFDILQHWMVFLDPPNHTRLRKLVMPAFTPKAAARLRDRIQTVVDEAIDAVRDRERFDFVREFAYPVPAIVIAEMLGIPREDRDRFKEWSDHILTLVFGAKGAPDRAERAQQALVQLADYLREHIRMVRKRPADDIIGSLVRTDQADPPLSDEELIATCVLLIFGGHETTTNLLANGTRALLVNDQWHTLRDDPDRVRTAVEELLRYDGPSKMIQRRLDDDVELHGQTMQRGQQVYLVQSSANRDPRAFDHPDTLDLSRAPNAHVTFGFGLHHCLGNFLARIEGQVVFETVTRELPGLARADGGREEWVPTLISRGMHVFDVVNRRV
ncbi:cytochrome P450 [Mycolicibacterium thermoresistibile]